MNDATREVGGVLGVAIVGSVVASAYSATLAAAITGLPAETSALARESIGAASTVATQIGGPDGQAMLLAAQEAFIHAADRGVLIAAGVALAGALAIWRTFPGRRRAQTSAAQPVPAAT